MFDLMAKKVKRKEIPRGSMWIFDNYKEIITKTHISPTCVTDAIWDKNKRNMLKFILGIRC